MTEWHGGVHTVSLRVFTVVARHGSFTTAARELGYTQSAVSRQIAALEHDTGVPLFDRLPRGVRLTEQGRSLLGHADAVLDRLEAARRDLTALRDASAGRLRVGAFATANAALLPAALAELRARHPGLDTTAEEALTPVLTGRLAAGDLDAAVVGSLPGRPVDGVALRPLLDDAMYVALPRAHRLAGRPAVRLADLTDEEWIAGRRDPEDTLMAAALRTGFRPRIGYVVAEWIAKQGFVAAGLGVTLVPSLAAGVARPDIALVPVDPADVPPRTVAVATPRGIAPSPAVAAFLTALDTAATTVPRPPAG
ncbi:LysR family transcriptional regulator [Nocardiopsis trehalosi]|uniref:LysR family transcriptional regulator n=1 Tax=Nocardiopsis trehalosi TaxID=109329 RepID=UPI00247FDEFA|nr:LysR family transcriptional regulator [Nocardiopsis trehalosi]